MSPRLDGKFTVMPSSDLYNYGHIRRLGRCYPAAGMEIALLKSVVRELAPLVDSRVGKKYFGWNCVVNELTLPSVLV